MSKLFIDPAWKQSNGLYKCPYCHKLFKPQGINTHIWRIHTNEGQNFDPNSSLKSGKRIIWNKGLSKNVDKRVDQYVKTRLNNIQKGKTVPSFKNKKHTERTKKQISQKLKDAIKNGSHPGWASQKLCSYPEQYFEDILKNNNISFVKQHHINDGKRNYFLDFYLPDSKINVEIDGKQHDFQDRIISDNIRDKYVSSLGISIFRIKWRDPNSQDGKKYLMQKIEDLIKLIKCNIQ